MFLCTITSLAWEISKVPDCHYFCPAVPDTAWFLADSRPCVEIVHMKEWLPSILTFNWILIDYYHLALSLSQLGLQLYIRMSERFGMVWRVNLDSILDFILTSLKFQFSSVQLLSCVWLFATPWITARQASLSITNSWSLPKLMPVESMMPSSHLILCCPFLLLPPIPPSIRVFSSESLKFTQY